jgi:hypothetical protein
MTSIIKKGAVGITNLCCLWLNQNKRDDKIAKTDDRLELNSRFSKAKGDWYYSLFLILKPKWMQV